MAFNKKGKDTECTQEEPILTEDELSDFDSIGKPATQKITGMFEVGETSPPPPVFADEDLAHLVAGCFVQVGSGEEAYWVEIGHIDGAMVCGMVHPELSGFLCTVDRDSCEIARFNRNQITALGCDRYCWC